MSYFDPRNQAALWVRMLPMLLLAALAMLLAALAMLLAVCDARAADDECIPGTSAYVVPFDPATGPYLRPNRDVKFCTSALPNLTSTIEMTCRVEVDGAPYAQYVGQQRELVVLTNPAVVDGVMSTSCEIPGIDENGDPTVLVGSPIVVDYDPTPVPEAPVPLD